MHQSCESTVSKENKLITIPFEETDITCWLVLTLHKPARALHPHSTPGNPEQMIFHGKEHNAKHKGTRDGSETMAVRKST